MTTFGDRVYELGGVPVRNGFPMLGNELYVKPTSRGGSNSNDGTSPSKAVSSIQRAITLQADRAEGEMDAIYIGPGTYAESVFADTLTNVAIIGAGADLVRIAPVAGHGLQIGAAGNDTYSPMTNVTLKGISFHTASTTNTEYAAVQTRVMRYSTIEDCKFLGASVATYKLGGNVTIGLQIGDREGTFGTTYEVSKENRISRCTFANYGGRTWELSIGLMVGDIDITTPDLRGFTLSTIEDCHFFCYDTGITFNSGASSLGGTVIKRNIISSNQGGSGVNIGIKSEAGSTDLLGTVADNRIAAISDCISNFQTCNVTGNMCALNGIAPVDETWI